MAIRCALWPSACSGWALHCGRLAFMTQSPMILENFASPFCRRGVTRFRPFRRRKSRHQVHRKKTTQRITLFILRPIIRALWTKGRAVPVEVQPGDEIPINCGVLSSPAYRVTDTLAGLPSKDMAEIMLSSKDHGGEHIEPLGEGG
jgi:hypothetical protein